MSKHQKRKDVIYMNVRYMNITPTYQKIYYGSNVSHENLKLDVVMEELPLPFSPNID